MYKLKVLLVNIFVLFCCCGFVFGDAQLQWRSLGGSNSLSYLVSGQTYELHAIGVDKGLDGWVIDFSGSTSGFTAAVDADRTSESVPGGWDGARAWDASVIPLSRGESFFEVSVADQVVANFVHDVATGENVSVTDENQFLCIVTIGGVGQLTTAGEGTKGLGDTEILGATVPVLASGFPFGDLNQSGQVDLADFTLFVERWLESECVYPDNCGGSDMDGNSFVNIYDLSRLADNWQTVN